MSAVLRTKRTEKKPNSGLPWTETEVTQLKMLYPKTSDKDLAAILARPAWGVTGKARALGLKKDYAGGYQRQQCDNPLAWSAEEEQLLTELFPTITNEEIAEQIGRTLSAIANKARNMGLRKQYFWSATEDDLLKKFYKKLTYRKLAQLLGRTKSAVQIRVITLGLECKVENWTEDEIEFLKKSYRKMTYHKIGEKLGRAWTAVAAKAENIGLIKKYHWTKAEIQKLKRLHTSFTALQIAEMMGYPLKAVQDRIRRLHLNKEGPQIVGETNLLKKQPQPKQVDTVAISQCNKELEASNMAMTVS